MSRYELWMHPGGLQSSHRTLQRAMHAQEKEVSKQRHKMQQRPVPGDRVIQGACAPEGWPDNVADCEMVVLYSGQDASFDVLKEVHVYVVSVD